MLRFSILRNDMRT